MIHLLGVVGTEVYNIVTQKKEYNVIMEVSEDVMQWLDLHDIKFDNKRNTIYICNEIEYMYIGPKLPTLDINKLNQKEFIA